MRKYILLIGIILILIVGGCREQMNTVLQEEKVEIPERTLERGESVIDLVLVETGEDIGDFQLGFLPPDDLDEETFEGWLQIYSEAGFDMVWNDLQTLSKADILIQSNINGLNRIYENERLDWADGKGNSMNAGQKDYMTGENFSSGEYYFYVATYTNEGIVGLSSVDTVYNVNPKPINVELSDGVITFESMPDERVTGTFMFLSEDGPTFINKKILDFEYHQLVSMDQSGRGMLLEALEGAVAINNGLKTIEGENPSDKNSYVYVASVGESGILGVEGVGMTINKKLEIAKTESIGDGVGTVILAGGGTGSKGDDNKAFFESIHTAAGGGRPRIAILSSSRKDAATVHNHFYYDDPISGDLKGNYEYHGFEPVFIPLAVDNRINIMDNPYFASLVKTCDAVYLQGGDQLKHIKSLYHDDGKKSELLKSIEYVYNRGGVIVGTSAGMAALGEYSFGLGYSNKALDMEIERLSVSDIPVMESYDAKVDGNNVLIEGLGILEIDAICDTHFDYRGRLGRLIAALRDTGKTYGIGSDEGTALIVHDNFGTVVGHQGVFIIDASQASFGDEIMGLKMHYLTSGDQFDFESRTVKFAGGNEDASYDSISYGRVHDGQYALTKAINAFAFSEEDMFDLVFATEVDSKLMLTLEKGQAFNFAINGKYHDSLLDNICRVSVGNMILSVSQKEVLDTEAPEIVYVKSYEKTYNVYLGVNETGSGFDLKTVNDSTVIFISNVNELYEVPYYDAPYNEIKVSIVGAAFAKGDMIQVKGVADLFGNIVENQVWIFDGDTWVKK